MLAKGAILIVGILLLSGCYFGPGEPRELPSRSREPPTEDDVEAAMAAFVSIPGAYQVEVKPDPFTDRSRDLHEWKVYHVDAARTRIHAESVLAYDCTGPFWWPDCKERPIHQVWEIGGTLRWEVEADGSARAYRDHLPGSADWLFAERSFLLSGFEPGDEKVEGNTSDGIPFTASVYGRSFPVHVSHVDLHPPGSDPIRFWDEAQPDDAAPPKMTSVERMPFLERLVWGNQSDKTLAGLEGAVPPQEIEVSCLDRDGVARATALLTEGLQTPDCSLRWTDEGDGLLGDGDRLAFAFPWGWELGVRDLWAD